MCLFSPNFTQQRLASFFQPVSLFCHLELDIHRPGLVIDHQTSICILSTSDTLATIAIQILRLFPFKRQNHDHPLVLKPPERRGRGVCRFGFYLWVHLALAMSMGMSVGQSVDPAPTPTTTTTIVHSPHPATRNLPIQRPFTLFTRSPSELFSRNPTGLPPAELPDTPFISMWGSRTASCVRPSLRTRPGSYCAVSPDRFYHGAVRFCPAWPCFVSLLCLPPSVLSSWLLVQARRGPVSTSL